MKRSGKFFVVYTSNKEPDKDPRIDIVAGLNVSKKAVLRNKIRRQTKDIIRGFGLLDKNKLMLNLRVVALPIVINTKFSELKVDLEKILVAL
ncbi:MAG: ribonuclease P protein component [Patescibacteria group bacterium]